MITQVNSHMSLWGETEEMIAIIYLLWQYGPLSSGDLTPPSVWGPDLNTD